MEGSALAYPTRRQASGADTALSNAVTSVTVSQQESAGQASEPAAGSTGEPQSPRAARSQVSTAVSFEGARAAGSAVQPERSVDEDSALSAAEPDGPVRSNRPQQGPRPANSLISTAVHPTMRHANNGGKVALPPQQHHHPLQQHQPQAYQQALLQHHQQQAHQQQQLLLQQQQRYAPPAAPSRAPHGRGVGLTAEHYASSPEVQRPHSITSQAVEPRAEGNGHAGRNMAEGQVAGPGRGLRTHPNRSNARGATPASVYGQIQAPGLGAPGPPSPRKDRQHSVQWPNPVGGGGSGAGGMDPAAAAAAAAAAFLGNGLVGGWGLMQGLGQGAPSITAAGHNQPALQHSLLAAAAAGASGALPLPPSPFNLAALGQLQLQAASHMQQQAAAAVAASAGAGTGLNGAPGAGVLWQPSEQADSVPGAMDLPPQPLGPAFQGTAPSAPTGHEQREQLLSPPHQQQLLQPQGPQAAAAGGGSLAANSPQDAGDGGRGDRNGTVGAVGGAHGQQAAISPPLDGCASRHRHRQGRPSYGVPAAALLGNMYGGAQSGVHPFALADMHGLQGLLMSASMSAAAAAAAAAGGPGGPADDGTGIGTPPGPVRAKMEQQHTRGSSQAGAQHLQAYPHPRSSTANTNGLQAQQPQQYRYAQQPVGDSHQQDALMFQGRGYGHGSQHGDVACTGAAAAAAVGPASSEAGRLGSGAIDANAAGGLHGMAAADPVVTTTATSVCGGGHGTVVEGGTAGMVQPGGGAAPQHPAMQLYVPVMLPLDLVSAQMAINQAAAAAAAAAGAATQTASPGDAGGGVPAAGACDKGVGGSGADGRGHGNAGGAGGSRDLPLGGATAAATTVYSTQALNTSPQRFLDFEHESAQQNVHGGSAMVRSDGGADGGAGRGQAALCTAASVARGGGVNGGYAGGSNGPVIPPLTGHVRMAAGDARGLMTGGGVGASTAGAVPLGNCIGPALSQHSAGSNPGAGGAGAGVGNPEPGALGLAAPAASVETVTASVAAPGVAGGAGLPPFDAVDAENAGAAVGGGGGVPAVVAAPAAAGAAFGGIGLGGNQHNHNNNVAINAQSNAYGAGPSMTQTADYRSHLQVALSLLLQATSAAYNSQRQSGIVGANEGSGIFAAAAQQASASNAVGQEMSDGMDGSGAGIGIAAGGVGAGVVSSGAGGGGGLDVSGSGAGRGVMGGGVGNGAVGHRDAGGNGGAVGAGVVAHSMHGAAMGPEVVATAEPMDTEGQVVDQATAASRGLHGGAGAAAAADMREVVAGTTPGLADDGGGVGEIGGGISGSPDAYRAPQWSTQRGGGAAGGGARSAVHGSSGGDGGAGLHVHHAAHHGQAAHHHHNHHHAQGPLQSPIGYHHRRGSGAGGSGSGSGKAEARAECACSPGVAQLEGALLGCGEAAGTAAAGASVGSAGGAAGGDGEQADNNSALQMDAEAGHPAASVHATVIAEESDASEGGGGDDSGSMEVPPVAAVRGFDGIGGTGGATAMGTGGGIAAGVGSSKAAVAAGLGEIVSQRFEGLRSRSREGQASKQPHDQLMQGPPAAGPGLGEVASHRAEMRSPVRHDGGVLDPRDSSMGMAAGPSHDGTDSGSNGATTSDTVDMAEDSRMGSASEHGDSGMGADLRDMMQTDENLLPLDEHGGENVGAIGISGGDDIEERGDDNDNAGSADGGDDGGGENVIPIDGDLDGDGDGCARMSVGPAVALLGMLGGGGGGASTGHMGPAAHSDGKGSPADKAGSHYLDRPDHLRHHPHQHPVAHHHLHLQTVSKEATGGGSGGGGVGVRASTSGTARKAHHHHHAGAAMAAMYSVSAAVALGEAGDDGGGGGGLLAAAGPAASGAAGRGGGGASAAAGGTVAAEALDDRGSPAPQAAQLQAANSTAMGSMRHGHGYQSRLGGEESGDLRAGGTHLHAYLHSLREDRRPAAVAAAAVIAGVGPAFSASNADRQNAGGTTPDGGVGAGGVAKASRSAGTAAKQGSAIEGGGGSAGGPAAEVGLAGGGAGAVPALMMEVMEMAEADMKSSSQEAAGSVGHGPSPSDGPVGQHPNLHHHNHQVQPRSQERNPQHQLLQSRQSGGESVPRVDADTEMSPPPPLHVHRHHHQQQMPPHHTQLGVHQYPHHRHQHHDLQQDAVNANENTTLAALGVGAALHPTSVLTTASQPPPALAPPPPDAQQIHNDGELATAAVISGAVPAMAQAITITHGSAGRGDGLLVERMSQEAVPQVTEIHGAFPGMAATAAEALALHQQEERRRFAAASVAAVEAEALAAAATATAADAQASWQGDEDRQPSGSPGGPSLSAVMPQFTEVHGAFTRTAGTAAEAQASGMLLRGAVASRGGGAECGGGGTGAGGATSGGNPGAADPRVGEVRRLSTTQAGARLTAPRDAEVVGVSGTPARGGDGGGDDGSASPQRGQADGIDGGCNELAFHLSRQTQQPRVGETTLSGGCLGLEQQHLQHHQQAMTHRNAGAAAAAASGGGGGAYGRTAAAGPSGLQGLGVNTGVSNYTKAESALHRTPASRTLSRGAGGDFGAWTFRSGRIRSGGGHDGITAGAGAAPGDARAPGSVDGHGSNGIAPLEPYGDDDCAATAAVSQSGEVMLQPAIGRDSGAMAGEAAAAVGEQAAADVQASSRRGDGSFVQLHGVGPAMSGDASRGGANANGCGAAGFGGTTPDTRRLPRHGLTVAGRGGPAWTQHQVSPPQRQQLQSQQQAELQNHLPMAGDGSGGGGGHQAQHTTVADGPLSTQAAAYGGYDDDYDSDADRRRVEGPPQPQMTILVTSHAANSHHTVSGGTAVVSEADNGVAGVGPCGAGGSPAVAAWEEEFDGPHRPPGGDAAQQQGSWRGGEGVGGVGGGPTKSAVMSSSRVEPHAYPQHSTPQGYQHYHHHHHHHHNPDYPQHNHPQQTPHVFPTQSTVFSEHPPDPSPTPQQEQQQQYYQQQRQRQQQRSTGRCASSQLGPPRQRRGVAGAGDAATGTTVGHGGAAHGDPMELDDGEAAGPAGGARGRGTARGRRGGCGRTRGEKRKRAHHSSDRE